MEDTMQTEQVASELSVLKQRFDYTYTCNDPNFDAEKCIDSLRKRVKIIYDRSNCGECGGFDEKSKNDIKQIETLVYLLFGKSDISEIP